MPQVPLFIGQTNVSPDVPGTNWPVASGHVQKSIVVLYFVPFTVNVCETPNRFCATFGSDEFTAGILRSFKVRTKHHVFLPVHSFIMFCLLIYGPCSDGKAANNWPPEVVVSDKYDCVCEDHRRNAELSASQSPGCRDGVESLGSGT